MRLPTPAQRNAYLHNVHASPFNNEPPSAHDALIGQVMYADTGSKYTATPCNADSFSALYNSVGAAATALRTHASKCAHATGATRAHCAHYAG
jgi:hypothetical protein